MQVIAVDIVGPLPESESGNSYVLVAGDYFTRWMEAYPIRNQEASTVARVLVDQWFCRFSVPEQLHSDQGRQFESNLLAEVCKTLGIQKTCITPYHPQCDGLVERFNRTILDMLATSVKGHPFDWEYHIWKVCFAYNTSIQSTTGYTPFFLLFGRQARIPADIMYPTHQLESTTHGEFTTTLKATLEKAYELVRHKTGMKHARQREFYDRRVHGKPFEVEDRVWLHSPVVPRGQSKKLHHPWIGPWHIIKRLSDAVYRIRSLKNCRKRLVVHFDRLKLCPPEMRLNADRQPSPTEPIPAHHSSPHLAPEPELVDDDDETDPPLSQQHRASQPPPQAPRQSQSSGRYPRRDRTIPDRYGKKLKYGTYFSGGGAM